ncbi:MAG TPA: YihY/virulence factor BrkB family protein [Candidatus Polarisedimenticolia bacterium]|nr:YihY/virulence factor BrkB family protein [Candidatus Polarisedimenticolia bacterium]
MPPPVTVTRRNPSPHWSFGGLTPRQFARRLSHRIYKNDLLGRASELAFDFLLAVFPLMLFMLTLFGLFASQSAHLQDSLLAHLGRFFPPSAFRLLSRVTDELAAHAGGGKLVFGIVVGLWFSTSGIASMMAGLNLAYRARETRSWLKVRAIALGLTLCNSVLVVFALGVALLGGRFVDWAGSVFHLEPIIVVLWRWLEWPIAVLFVATSFSLIYYYGPDLERRRWRWISAGSLFGALLWLAASLGFRGYLHFFNAYSTTYGSLGAVMILLIWLYVAGLAFLIGGEINAEIESAAGGDRGRPKAAV